MILFIDTETTGKADFNKRASDPSQPHIVQYAHVLCDDDLNELETYQTLVSPGDWIIPPEAVAIHGITNERAQAEGIYEAEVAVRFMANLLDASLLVGHNIQFDKFCMRVACRRYGVLGDDQAAWWSAFPQACTMRALTNVCRLPGPYGYKWPKLTEAYKHAFGRELEGAHDALKDVRATVDLYRWMRNEGLAQVVAAAAPGVGL